MPSFNTSKTAKAVLLVVILLVGVANFARTSKDALQIPFAVTETRQLEIDPMRELINENDKLRVAAFGSSNTYGAGVANRFDAYPFLLSQSVDNYADFAAGPNYPSVCTESIIGDDKAYDVILLEFWLRAHEGLEELARRLRARFPRAIIIFVKLWGPFHARRKANATSTEKPMLFVDWKKTVEAPNGQLNEYIELLDNDDGYWYFPDHKQSDVRINRAARAVGGYQMHMPHEMTTKESLVHYLRFFDKDFHTHLSEKGHSLVANMTKQIIHNHVQNNVEEDQVNVAGDLGTWGRGDSCHLWLTSGALNFAHSENWIMREYDTHAGKFALEISSEGWIDITNPLEDIRELFLSFVSSNDGQYPIVEVTYSGPDGEVKHFLDPAHTLDLHHSGLTRTLSVGGLAPGQITRIHMKPVSDTPSPFRLVGASFSNQKQRPLDYFFGPMFNV